ncbi:MAG: phenylalanine--tRNA ligase subunit beta [Gemmatimonadota bacterium]
MKVSLRWLQAIVPGLHGSPAELSDRLASRGCPVESVTPLGAGLDDIRVARVRSVRPHPNADRLRICEVEDGSGTVQVVCGAPNVTEGGVYPFAPVGAVLPGGSRIGKAKLRGETSEGMLCSERELGLGPGEAGLMVLHPDLEPGASLIDVLGLDDVRLDVEVTSNRPDLLSHEGIARELAPDGAAALRLPEIPGEPEGLEAALEGLARTEGTEVVSSDEASVQIEAPELCGRYLGLVIRGVRVGPSPDWLRSRLRAAGGRPINNVVDATNYVLLELGQPLHAFDLDRLEGGRIRVRAADAGESIETLDGVRRTLEPGMLAICDAVRPVAVAGVMGGADSEVSESTSNVFLECALFTPGPIRSTRKALGLSTDASYRFERGVDPEGMLRALLRAARILVATGGGEIAGPILDCASRPFARTRIPLRPERIGRVLGIPFSPEVVRGLLEPLGFALEEDGGVLSVEVPGFRSYDVTREVDLIEEVARTHGFEAFPQTLHPFRPSSVPDHPLFALEDRLRDLLVGLGFLEAQTPAFAPAAEGEVALQNPISAEEGFLRTRLAPGLVRRVEYNLARGNRDVRLFELGTVFRTAGPGEVPHEETRLALILHSLREPKHWSGEGVAFDLWDLKGLLTRIATVVRGGDGWEMRSAEAEYAAGAGFTPNAMLVVSGPEVGDFGIGGSLSPGRADVPPWADPIWAIEVALPAEPAAPQVPVYRALPAHPGIDRDLALLVPGEVSVEVLLARVRDQGGETLREVGVFDVYREDAMPIGTRSVAIRLRFRASNRTLTDAEVDEAVEQVTQDLARELRVEVRGSQG